MHSALVTDTQATIWYILNAPSPNERQRTSRRGLGRGSQNLPGDPFFYIRLFRFDSAFLQLSSPTKRNSICYE